MSENPHQDLAATEPSNETRTFDFPALLQRLHGPLTPAQVARAGDTLAAAKRLFETAAQETQPLPGRLVRVVESMCQEFARMEGLQARLATCVAGAAPRGPAMLVAPGQGGHTASPGEPSPTRFRSGGGKLADSELLAHRKDVGFRGRGRGADGGSETVEEEEAHGSSAVQTGAPTL